MAEVNGYSQQQLFGLDEIPPQDEIYVSNVYAASIDEYNSGEGVTITNGVIDADNNSISNIDNSAIKANAGIDASKIADGSVSNTQFESLSELDGGVILTQTNTVSNISNKTFEQPTCILPAPAYSLTPSLYLKQGHTGEPYSPSGIYFEASPEDPVIYTQLFASPLTTENNTFFLPPKTEEPTNADTLVAEYSKQYLREKTLLSPVIDEIISLGGNTLTVPNVTGTIITSSQPTFYSPVSASFEPAIYLKKDEDGPPFTSSGIYFETHNESGYYYYQQLFGNPGATDDKTYLLPASTPQSVSDTLVAIYSSQVLYNKTLVQPYINEIKKGVSIITVPEITDTLVTRTATETLTNKTLSSPIINNGTINNGTLVLPVISQISNTGTLTLPTTTDTLIGQVTSDTLKNKTFEAAVEDEEALTVLPYGGSGTLPAAIKMSTRWDLGYYTYFCAPETQTADRVIYLPEGTGPYETLVSKSATQTLTNKTLTSPTINNPTITNGGYTITLPSSSNQTLVGRSTTDTLTNKTISDPYFDTHSLRVTLGTVYFPNISTTLVGKDTPDVLENKTLEQAKVKEPSGATAGYMLFYEAPDNGTNYTQFQASNSLSANTVAILPNESTTLVGTGTTDTLTNKTIADSEFYFNYQCEMRMSAHMSSVGAGPTKIQFNTAEYDPDGMCDTTNYEVDVLKAGFYLINVTLAVSSTTTDESLRVYVAKNGSYYRLGDRSASDYGTCYPEYTFLVQCDNDSDYLSFYFYHNVGTVTITAGTSYATSRVRVYQHGQK